MGNRARGSPISRYPSNPEPLTQGAAYKLRAEVRPGQRRVQPGAPDEQPGSRGCRVGLREPRRR
jgi:hypothetical protein